MLNVNDLELVNICPVNTSGRHLVAHGGACLSGDDSLGGAGGDLEAEVGDYVDFW